MLGFTNSFLLLFLIRGTLGDPNAPCYFPSGDVALGYFPCDANAYIVQCCPTGWTCYSNGLCVITDPATSNQTAPVGTSIRGTCTDPKWVNPICGEYCLDEKTTDAVVEPCGNDTFCCESAQQAGNCNCSDGTGVFSLGSGLVQTIIGVNGLTLTSTSTILPSKTGGPTTLSTATKPAASAASNKKGLSRGATIGIGVGVGVGVAAVLISALMLYCRRGRGERAGPAPVPVSQETFLARIPEIRANPVYGGGDPATADSDSL